jgi:poly(A) polymerase
VIEETLPSNPFLGSPAAREAAAIVARLREQGFQAWLAGGCVRDAILRGAPDDFDIATSARPWEVVPIFPHVVETGVRYGTVTVVGEHGDVQVTTFRRDADYADGRHPGSLTFGVSLEDDAQRRDLTINALFADPFSGRVLDLVGGLADLRAGLVRSVGVAGDRFDEDALRLLRTVRFAARFDFAIEPGTRRAACARPHLLRKLSAERIGAELEKMLTGRHVGRALLMLDEFGFLAEIAPEVAAMRGVPQPPQFHRIGDVFLHTVDVVERLERRDRTLALAALFHDTGKVTTLSVSDRIRFHGHEPASCQLAEPRLRALRFPGDVIDNVLDLVAEHIRIGGYRLWRRAKQIRFLQKSNIDDHLVLHRADCESAHGLLENLYQMQSDLAALRSAPPPQRPLITGADLIAMGHTPGREFKRILEAIRDAQLEGKICTRDDALRMAERDFPPGAGGGES